MDQDKQLSESDIIDPIKVIKKIWKGRYITIFLVVLSTVIGISFALLSPKVYTANTTFIPKGKSGSPIGGSLGSLAALAGINLGNMGSGGSDIPPNLYPLLVNSNPFTEKISKVHLPSQRGEITFSNYLSQDSEETFFAPLIKYTIGLPSLIKIIFRPKEDTPAKVYSKKIIKRYSAEEDKLFKVIRGLIRLSIDEKEGFITVSVQDKNPEIAAIIALNVQKLLQEEIINFKIKNANVLLNFTEKLYFEKKMAFEVLQDKLAEFLDKNQNISSTLFQNKLSRLKGEVQIAQSVNEELAKQVEQARIQISRDTPIFTIIEPVVVPNQRTSPKRGLIVISFAFIGFAFGISFALFKDPISSIYKQIFINK